MARFSRLVTITISPFEGYRALAEEVGAMPSRDARARIVFGVLRLLFVIGAFVSFTSTGRLSPLDVLLAAGSYSWMPLVQALGVAAGARMARADTKLETLLALYFDGHGVWFAALLAIVSALLFSTNSLSAVAYVAPIGVLVALVWGIVTTFALFRRGAGLPRGRAVVATSAFYLVAMGCVVGYYVAQGQLLPILPFAGGPK